MRGETMKKITSGKKRWVSVVLWIAIGLVALLIAGYLYVYTVISGFFSKEYWDEPMIIKSPDGSYQLMIYEWDWLRGSGTEIYISDASSLPGWNYITRVKLGELIADSGLHPLSDANKNYEIIWKNDHIIITYYNGLTGEFDDPTTWRSDRYDLPKRYVSDE